ncbi:hypothetical protein IWQ61_010271 [Dispira simplex]|nr:hypothetical protein IWQ61_010271 [Dispira simplex]
MKINILTIAPLVLTTLLVVGSPVDAYSNVDAIEDLLFFSSILGHYIDRDISLDKDAREILRDKKRVNEMLEVAKGIIREASPEKEREEIAKFLTSDFGQEFLKDLEEITSMDDENISDREAKIGLLFFAKPRLFASRDFYYFDKEIRARLYSWKMAKAMLEVANDVKMNPPEEFDEGSDERSDKDMITEFLASIDGRTFHDDLIKITNYDKEVASSSELPKWFIPSTTATKKLTLMYLIFILYDGGAHLFSEDDIPVAVRALRTGAGDYIYQ